MNTDCSYEKCHFNCHNHDSVNCIKNGVPKRILLLQKKEKLFQLKQSIKKSILINKNNFKKYHYD